MRKVFYVFAVGLMLLTACGKKTAANDQESKESE